jgi:hypothetical protein
MAQYYASPKLLSEADLFMEWMVSNLNLREDQLEAIAYLNVKYTVRLDSIRSSPADRFVKFQKAYQVMHARDKELKFILTKEQFITYQSTKEGEENDFSLHEERIDGKQK